MNSINWPALSVWVFIAQAGRALPRKHRGHGFESRYNALGQEINTGQCQGYWIIINEFARKKTNSVLYIRI